ncbi:hypothetical protein I79_023214 [Cricetulus griseus]|uniref:Uncharacterized protein n=1 Tax=Cricetulus griseus TaxID=10029 RepID=G3IHC5_CRIGR|nr:hypothetical protein I79_023214 [Cricetulus griseus]
MTTKATDKRWLEGSVGGKVPWVPTDPEVGQLQNQLDETVRRDMTTFDEALAKVGKGEDMAVDIAR